MHNNKQTGPLWRIHPKTVRSFQFTWNFAIWQIVPHKLRLYEILIDFTLFWPQYSTLNFRNEHWWTSSWHFVKWVYWLLRIGNKLYNPIRRHHLFKGDEDMNFATVFPESEEAGQAEIQDMPSEVYKKFYIRLADCCWYAQHYSWLNLARENFCCQSKASAWKQSLWIQG